MNKLDEKVKKWLETSGYSLEMEVAKNLHKAQFDVIQSEFIEDPESQKWRETDVVAYTSIRSKTCKAVFALIAECKGGKDKPWVLLSSKDNYPDTLSVSRRASSTKGLSILGALALKEKIIKALYLFYLNTLATD